MVRTPSGCTPLFLCPPCGLLYSAYASWPETSLTWFGYTWGIFKSLGYASVTLIALWVSVFPVILNFAFENMIGKILQDKRVPIKGEGSLIAVTSSIQVIFRTLGWRIFWPLATLISLFFLGPLAMFLAQVGMGHIAIIDACDLSLAIQGQPVTPTEGIVPMTTVIFYSS